MDISWIFSKSFEHDIAINKNPKNIFFSNLFDNNFSKNYLILTLVDSLIQQPTLYESPSLYPLKNASSLLGR